MNTNVILYSSPSILSVNWYATWVDSGTIESSGILTFFAVPLTSPILTWSTSLPCEAFIENSILTFHEVYASSACELVTELIEYSENDIS